MTLSEEPAVIECKICTASYRRAIKRRLASVYVIKKNLNFFLKYCFANACNSSLICLLAIVILLHTYVQLEIHTYE